MNKIEALRRLKSTEKPMLIDGGYWKFGHMLFVLTSEGLITVDCRVYDPILGPIEFTQEQYAEITEISRECDTIAENDDLDPDEKLFLFNNGKPEVPYYAFQPHDNAALDEYVFSSDKAEIEQAFIAHSLGGKVETWEDMDEKKLIEWLCRIGLDEDSGERE
ncbi:MAG: hypothetical protein HGA72_01845 [Chlorobiaceae bacterium]|jgi:hypothetical protein|nr:hypothetical protein [Chlorobiaceae bacterium]NTW63976.1 hypothetical protein [Chlorobiaceae bacterium]